MNVGVFVIGGNCDGCRVEGSVCDSDVMWGEFWKWMKEMKEEDGVEDMSCER